MQLRLYVLASLFATAGLSTAISSCDKLVSIPPPVNTLTTTQVFANDQQATSAMAGVYDGMINTPTYTVFNGGATIYAGVSADEFLFFNEGNGNNVEFQENALLSGNLYDNSLFWLPIFSTIYGCNSVLSGVRSSGGVSDSVRNELIGEAEFVRAFANFYLVNLFGTAPLVTTIDYNKTELLPNSGADTLYAAILADLKDAQQRLPADYSVGNGQRIIPNKWAATALLARTYLYQKDFDDAAAQASSIIGNTGLYSLTTLDQVFLINSSEAIWQLQQTLQSSPYNATREGYSIIPASQTSQPFIYLTDALLCAFDDTDYRRGFWVDSTVYAGATYFYPRKYQIGPALASPTAAYTEYYMVLRLAEQYLIRAEAEANGAGSGVAGAIADLDVIRRRAGLSGYAGPQDADSVLAAIVRERRLELFGEWGHRWLDLKRWGVAPTVLSGDKPNPVSVNALLFPIPFIELQTDPNLKQNPGYH